MSEVRIPAQFIKVFHKASADRVEVNVAYQFQKVGFLLAQYRFKAVLENVAVSAVLPIVPQCVTGYVNL